MKRGVERMQGTPWHIETHKVTYEKKRKCIFDKKRNKKDIVELPKTEPRLLIGALFRVMDLDSGEMLDFEIVRSEDIDIDENKINPKAPIAIEVAKAKVGDIITVNENVQYEVLEVDNRNKAQREKSLNKKKKQKQKNKKRADIDKLISNKNKMVRSKNKIRIID